MLPQLSQAGASDWKSANCSLRAVLGPASLGMMPARARNAALISCRSCCRSRDRCRLRAVGMAVCVAVRAWRAGTLGESAVAEPCAVDEPVADGFGLLAAFQRRRLTRFRRSSCGT